MAISKRAGFMAGARSSTEVEIATEACLKTANEVDMD
jgi:hypothetical protein